MKYGWEHIENKLLKPVGPMSEINKNQTTKVIKAVNSGV